MVRPCRSLTRSSNRHIAKKRLLSNPYRRGNDENIATPSVRALIMHIPSEQRDRRDPLRPAIIVELVDRALLLIKAVVLLHLFRIEGDTKTIP